MSSRLAALALASAFAGSVAAQDVVLGGWELPEGAVVIGAGTFTSEMRVSRTDLPAPFLMRDTISLRVRFEVVDVGSEGVLQARATTTDFTNMEHVWSGEDYWGEREQQDPLLGRTLLYAREGSAWRVSLEEGSPTPEQTSLINATRVFELEDEAYTDLPLSPGAEWEVSKATLHARFGPLADDEPARMTFRLDSVGTHEGRAAAFLSYSLTLTQAEGEGGRRRLEETGTRVRFLDERYDAAMHYVQRVRRRYEGPNPDGVSIRSEVESRVEAEVRRWRER